MKKLSVLEIIGDATLAGAPRHLLGLLENFDYQKFNLFAITPPGPLAGEIAALKRPIEVDIVQMHSKIDLAAIREIRKSIKHLKPDLIHVHGTRAGVLGRLAAIGLGIPVIYTEHLWTKNYRLPGRIAHQIQLIGLWFLDMFTNYNIAVSSAVKDFMVENQISRPSKITVIYNGIKHGKEKAAIFSHEKMTLGTIGTLNYQKGIQYLILAMPLILNEFPQTQLIIIGEGTYRRHLEDLVKRLKLKKYVTFTGFLKDIEEELTRLDIYVQPSLSESFGLAIIQAMSLGLPVVATNTGGIPEVVTTGKSGILVQAGSPKALAQGLLELLRDRSLSQKMGKVAASDVRIKFNLADVVSQTEKVYEKMAQNRA